MPRNPGFCLSHEPYHGRFCPPVDQCAFVHCLIHRERTEGIFLHVCCPVFQEDIVEVRPYPSFEAWPAPQFQTALAASRYTDAYLAIVADSS